MILLLLVLMAACGDFESAREPEVTVEKTAQEPRPESESESIEHGRQELFTGLGFIHGREVVSLRSGLAIRIPEDRTWRITAPGFRAREVEDLAYEFPQGGISGRLLVLGAGLEPASAVAGYTRAMKEAKVETEEVQLGDRTWVMATAVTEPITLRFAATKIGERVLMFQHLCDAEVSDLGRADALAFLGAVVETGRADREFFDRDGQRFLRARASGTVLPFDAVEASCLTSPLITIGVDQGAIETLELKDGGLLRSICAERQIESLDAAVQAAFSGRALPEAWTSMSDAQSPTWTGQVLHEDAIALYALRRFGSIWQGLRVEGRDLNEVSGRFQAAMRYLRSR